MAPRLCVFSRHLLQPPLPLTLTLVYAGHSPPLLLPSSPLLRSVGRISTSTRAAPSQAPTPPMVVPPALPCSPPTGFRLPKWPPWTRSSLALASHLGPALASTSTRRGQRRQPASEHRHCSGQSYIPSSSSRARTYNTSPENRRRSCSRLDDPSPPPSRRSYFSPSSSYIDRFTVEYFIV